ncbi:Uncharacterised protein [Leminorella grimontii]|nr:hypothetical protein GLGR_1216 [Leminorella grimontii ATCC 33999 = DSM 5078]VFS58457.1 Uncharacterised protein [Leminorella grimontii]
MRAHPNGWKYDIAMTTSVEEAGKQQIGQINSQGFYALNEQGWISVYKNTITTGLSGQSKSTIATSHYRINDKNQLVFSQTDKGLDRGEVRYTYNSNGQPEFIVSQKKQISTVYDANGRNLAFFSITLYPWALISASGRCQEWDKQDNCTLVKHSEIEIGKKGQGTSRNLETRTVYRYWDDAK